MRLLMRKLILFFLSLQIYSSEFDSWFDLSKDRFISSGYGVDLQEGPVSAIIKEDPSLICQRNDEVELISCKGVYDQNFTAPEFLAAALSLGEGKKIEINTLIAEVEFLNEFTFQDGNAHYVIKSAFETTYSVIPLTELALISDLFDFEVLFAKFANYRYLVSENQLEIGNFYLENDFLIISDGTRFYANDEFFEGSFDEFGSILNGRYSYSNGETYIGNFLNNYKSGYGEYFYNSGDIYKGNHFRDAPHGFGTFYFSVGDIYEGDFKNGNFTGEAKYTSANSDIIVYGTFVDAATKSGTEYDAKGRIIYSGEYLLKLGSPFIRHGQGKQFIYMDNGTVLSYEGEFKNGNADGYGTYIENGFVYTGDFVNNQFTGEGKVEAADFYLEGTFENYQIKEGKQVYDDWEYHGKWLNGQYEGEAKLITKNTDGSKFEEFVQFKNGVYVGEIESDPTLFNISAQKRFALIIGNSNYSSSYGYANLDNPINDAELMHARLENAGFEVTTVKDANEADFIGSINNFKNRVNSSGRGTVALFYYSGHGLQVDGINYLVPTDAQIEDEFDLEAENISTRRIMSAFEENINGTNIIILDACRNNPFARTFNRSSNTGLVAMDAPTGTYIAYSTAPGRLAADGVGNNSLFTQSLAENMLKKGLSIEDVFKNTRRDVANETNNRQVPWSSSSLIGDFYFIP